MARYAVAGLAGVGQLLPCLRPMGRFRTNTVGYGTGVGKAEQP